MSAIVLDASPEHRRGARLLSVALEHPAAVYAASLSTPISRVTMIDALKKGCRFFGSTPAELAWSELTYAHLTSLRAHLVESCSPSTGNKVLSAFRGTMRHAVRLGLMSHEKMLTACDVDSIRGHRERRGRALSADEIARMVAFCAGRGLHGARDRALLGVLFGGGLRRSEAAQLNAGSLTEEGFRILGKGNKERNVPVPESVRRAVAAWEALMPSSTEERPLFVRFVKRSPTSSRITAKGIYAAIKRLGARAGLAPFSPHDLRSTYIGDLFDVGVDISTIQHLVGHSSPTTTARYDRRPSRTRRAAADRVVFPF